MLNDPRRALVIARVGLAVSALLALLNSYATLLAVTGNRVQRPAWGWLPEVTPTRAAVVLAVLLVPSLCLLLGRPGRASSAAVGAGLLGLFAWEQQTYSNHVALCALLCLWFALSPRDDPRLLMTQLSVCYFFAGLVKVRPEFLSGDTLRSYLDLDLDLDLPGSVWPVLGTGTVAVELGLAICLWLPRLRLPAAMVGLLFHLSVPLAMSSDRYGLASFSLTCLCLYPLFLSRSVEHGAGKGEPLEHRRVASEGELRPGRRRRVGQ